MKKTLISLYITLGILFFSVPVLAMEHDDKDHIKMIPKEITTHLKVSYYTTNKELLQLVSRFPKLTSLNLSYNGKITDEGVSKLPNLTHLNLGGNENITDKGLSELTNLTILNLKHNDNINITDVGV